LEIEKAKKKEIYEEAMKKAKWGKMAEPGWVSEYF